jgi:hypothetical protein
MANDIPIKQLIKELSDIRIEIKNRKDSLKKITDREKDIKNKIQIFLKSQNQQGIKDNSQGLAVINEKVLKSERKKKKETKEEMLVVLRNYMDDERAKKIFNELNQTKNSEKIEKEILKVIKI